MSSERGKNGFRAAYPNSGLESLAQEASRRAESMDTETEAREERENSESKSPRSPTNPKGKVRKAYTITKQRERWTEEEHDRFLQALKRYGRAWRKIEEHIGTKTAVQIRSHAQKFFSKLQREQSMNGKDESSKNDISIPPPRPKRKPMHPYPRNSIDSNSDPHEQPRPAQKHQPSPPKHDKDSEATTSTQVNTSHQYSNSSGQQGFLNAHPLFQGGNTPFSGSVISPQPSQVQLPPFPSLDTSGGDSMNKVLKDAAMAAASAWNQVIQGASQKVQHLIQAQSFNPNSLQSAPSMWTPPQYAEATETNPFVRQLLYQVTAQHPTSQGPTGSRHGQAMYPRQASTTTLTSHQQDTMSNVAAAYLKGQRLGSMHDNHLKPEREAGDSDKDSACSKEGLRPNFSRATFSTPQGQSYWSSKTPYSASEANLGRTAWEMMNRVTAQKSLELAKAKTEEAKKTTPMKAPSTGASAGSRRIMKPIAHSARISPLHTRDSTLQSTNCSNTSQLAQFYQRAAEAHTRTQSPEGQGHGSSGTGEIGHGLQNVRKSDKESNTATGSDEKDQGSNGSEQPTSPKVQDLAGRHKDAGKDIFDDLGTQTKGTQIGSDKASNNGNENGSSDEDAPANGSDGNGAEEKGSNNGSNSDQASPRETTPAKDVRSITQPIKEAQKNHTYTHGALPHDSEAAWATTSLQNQQKMAQEDGKHGRSSQAEMMQQILPFTLTKEQQAAISTWAAANAQSQPQQYQLMQSLLNGLTSTPENTKFSPGPAMLDRQISSLTSHDTGSNTECNTGIGRGLGLDSHRSVPGELPKRPSGFQPYNKRAGDSSLIKPPAKRFAGANSLDRPLIQGQDPQDFVAKRPYSTPFGTDAAQSSQVV